MDSNIDYNFYFKDLLSNIYKSDIIVIEELKYDKIGFVNLNNLETRLFPIDSFHSLAGTITGTLNISINTNGIIENSTLINTDINLKYPKLNTQIITLTLFESSNFSGIINK